MRGIGVDVTKKCKQKGATTRRIHFSPLSLSFDETLRSDVCLRSGRHGKFRLIRQWRGEKKERRGELQLCTLNRRCSKQRPWRYDDDGLDNTPFPHDVDRFDSWQGGGKTFIKKKRERTDSRFDERRYMGDDQFWDVVAVLSIQQCLQQQHKENGHTQSD